MLLKLVKTGPNGKLFINAQMINGFEGYGLECMPNINLLNSFDISSTH